MSTQPFSTSEWDRPAQKSVLVVDDNPLNRGMFCALLRTAGYRVFDAWDGLSGLETARDLRPDLIILDVHLPGLSGLEIRRRLRAAAETQAIPMLVATADWDPGIEAEVQSSGRDGFMAKPINIAKFIAMAEWLILRAEVDAAIT
jgi:two-component system cell cycle response regulator DivK